MALTHAPLPLLQVHMQAADSDEEGNVASLVALLGKRDAAMLQELKGSHPGQLQVGRTAGVQRMWEVIGPITDRTWRWHPGSAGTGTDTA